MRTLLLDVSAEKATCIESTLADDEELLWSGEPTPRAFTPSSLAVFVFAIGWTGISVFCFVLSILDRGDFHELLPWGLPAFCLMFVVVGLVLLSMPYYEHRALARTVYAVTRRRALIITEDGRRQPYVRAYAASELTPIIRSERSDGTADVTFAVEIVRTSSGRRRYPRRFYGIRDACGAERALRALSETST